MAMVEERVTTQADIDSMAAGCGLFEESVLDAGTIGDLFAGAFAKSVEMKSYYIDGDLVAVSGYTQQSLLDDEAEIWLVTAAPAKKHAVAFARHSRRMLNSLRFTKIHCLCDPDFERTCRWLSWLGFATTAEVNVAGKKFIALSMEVPRGN